MSKLNTTLESVKIERLVIWQAATNDGYWEDAANKDIQYIYKLGMLRATESFHSSYGNHATKLRIKRLRDEVEELEKHAYREEKTSE